MASVTYDHVWKRYGDVVAVQDLNLAIEDKEFLVLVGPSGCGKTTALRCLAGLEEISEGTVKIGDQVVNDVAPKDRDIAMVFQSYALYPHMSVYDNMAFGLKLRKFDKADIDRRVKEAARTLGIENLLKRKPKELSGGQRQRVAVGRAIVREPKVFLFDEPLSNLDAKLRVQTRAELSKLHKRLETTFIYVTHDQTEAMTMGSRICIMKDGFIQQVDTPQNNYDFPQNKFVASFIGSPQMNFFDVKLVSENGKVYALFGDSKVLVPDEKVKKLVDESYIGKEVIMGVRPENISDNPEIVAAHPETTVDVHVEVTELMGSETYLYFSTSGKEDNVIARVDPRTKTHTGDDTKVAFDTTRLHFFDKETEATILNR
ncbi:MAG: ABC transporter ATP-binding protein [Chloroflexota bacterium]|nr:ABC transporter ATP-binding protein [Chloroflexota bacterium]